MLGHLESELAILRFQFGGFEQNLLELLLFPGRLVIPGKCLVNLDRPWRGFELGLGPLDNLLELAGPGEDPNRLVPVVLVLVRPSRTGGRDRRGSAEDLAGDLNG